MDIPKGVEPRISSCEEALVKLVDVKLIITPPLWGLALFNASTRLQFRQVSKREFGLLCPHARPRGHATWRAREVRGAL